LALGSLVGDTPTKVQDILWGQECGKGMGTHLLKP